MKTKVLRLDGKDLNTIDLNNFLKDDQAKIEIAPTALKRVNSARKFLDQELANGKILYGINTGFGPMASHIVPLQNMAALQENLIRSHSTGIGLPIDSRFVLATMIVRLNTLVKGYSGVSKELLDLLQNLINKRIIPLVPEHGAVGTSGDLVQLAHIASTLMGEGEAYYQGQLFPASVIFKKLGLKPHKWQSKEGLAMINGTAVMTGISSVICSEVSQVLAMAVRLGAFAYELVGGFDDSIDQNLHDLRPHHGQSIIAGVMRNLLKTSKRLKTRSGLARQQNSVKIVYKIDEDVQQVYSLRCNPQIVGPIYESFLEVSDVVEIEMNSVTDNPIVDWQHKKILHGGNFHGDYIAAAIDRLKAGLVKLSLLSERRVNYFLNQKVNKIFPPFLNLKEPGLTMALQGLQFVATSIAAQNQTLAYPHHLHTIPTNADNQDIVSMGTDAALLAYKVLENTFNNLVIESVVLAQCFDFIKDPRSFSNSALLLYKEVRKIFPAVIEDRSFSSELTRLIRSIRQSDWVRINWQE